MTQLVRMPRRQLSFDELEIVRAEHYAALKKSERIRGLLVYGGIAATFFLGMLFQHLFTR